MKYTRAQIEGLLIDYVANCDTTITSEMNNEEEIRYALRDFEVLTIDLEDTDPKYEEELKWYTDKILKLA